MLVGHIEVSWSDSPLLSLRGKCFLEFCLELTNDPLRELHSTALLGLSVSRRALASDEERKLLPCVELTTELRRSPSVSRDQFKALYGHMTPTFASATELELGRVHRRGKSGALRTVFETRRPVHQVLRNQFFFEY